MYSGICHFVDLENSGPIFRSGTRYKSWTKQECVLESWHRFLPIPSTAETNIRFYKNVHHTYIVQPHNSNSSLEDSDEEGSSPPQQNHHRCTRTTKKRPQTTSSSARKLISAQQHHQDRQDHRAAAEAAQLTGAVDYRQRFLRSVARKPLYMNKHFASNPCELIGRIADQLVRQTMRTVEAQIELNEVDIVRSFLRSEAMAERIWCDLRWDVKWSGDLLAINMIISKFCTHLISFGVTFVQQIKSLHSKLSVQYRTISCGCNAD